MDMVWKIVLVAALTTSFEAAFAKGLNDISDPPAPAAVQDETATDAAEAGVEQATSGDVPETQEPTEQAASVTASATREVTEKFYLATSFGWVNASRSEGEWKGSGLSDFTLGYRLPVELFNLAWYGTYRYAPVVVAGTVDSNSYRGVWEMHYFGGTAFFDMGSFSLTSSAEIGYGLVYLNSTDGLDGKAEHEDNGVSVVLGSGADWEVLGEKGFRFGPRLNIGFGSFSTVQVNANLTYLF